MKSKRATVTALGRRAAANAYFDASKKPLQILVFLLPLVIAYEIALAFFLPTGEGVVITVKAHQTLLRFFDTFGITAGGGLYLGGAALIVVLLIWHVLTKDKWKVDGSTWGLMAAESIVLTIPLIVLAQVILPSSVSTEAVATSLATAAQEIGSLSKWSQFAISVGAGLYEELLFRMLLIAVIHTLLVDVVKISTSNGATIAVIISAIAFTIYHPLDGTGSVVFYFLAGLYFGSIYVVRGFGIVVGVHAVYDIIMVSKSQKQSFARLAAYWIRWHAQAPCTEIQQLVVRADWPSA